MAAKPTFMKILFSHFINNKNWINQFYRAKSVMIVAPHPDDEVLGCGGILIYYGSISAVITIIYLTDGRYGLASFGKTIRKDEALSIGNIIPSVQQYFYNLEDSTLDMHIPQVTCILAEAINNFKPDVVFTPWLLDRHSDHYTASFCLSRSLKTQSYKGVIACYEVMTPLTIGHTVNITDYYDQKNALIDQYLSQVKLYNIKAIINNLNSYRAALSRRKNIKYAEFFYLTDSNKFVSLVDIIYRSELFPDGVL